MRPTHAVVPTIAALAALGTTTLAPSAAAQTAPAVPQWTAPPAAPPQATIGPSQPVSYAPLPPTAYPPQTEPVSAMPGIRVELHANRSGAVLERRVGSIGLLDDDGRTSGNASLWERVCAAPCAAVVAPGDRYRVAGEGAHPSRSFTLAPNRSDVRLDADVGSEGALSLGKGFVSSGIGLLALGTVMLVVPAPGGDDPSTESAWSTLHTVGYAAVGAGAALTLIGLPLWISNATTVKTDTGRNVGALPMPPSPRGVILGARGVLF